MSLLADVISILLNGFQQGAIYVLLAVGLSLILGTLEFVNFAHGALYIIGAYTGVYVAQGITISEGYAADLGISSLGLGWGFIAALIIASIVVFVIGLLFERFVARAFYDRPDTDQILVTFGLAIIVQEAIRVTFGSNSQPFNQPAWASGTVPIPGVAISEWRIWIVVITAALVGLVFLLVEYTDFGLVVRAGTMDSEMVRLLGIKLTRPYLLVFGIGSALAGVAGVVGGPLSPINPTAGTDILVPAFVTVVIGGVGSIRGAVAGGLTLGMTQAILIQTSIGTYNLAQWSQVGIYAIAAIILLYRPQGLLGDEVKSA
ncbi:branched-chain amino acid ABC transporter permease [Natronomonas sp. EA1]|uniref:branched-chain amino acid ABC transporter permease n=1 Tax=Natronomonas sp. EA1 TaxID=3421655 RepID=UPI003EB7A875